MQISRDKKALMALAKRVKALRIASEVSQEQLAFDCEIDRTYISKIERGIANPSFLILVRIAMVLRVSLIELVATVK